MDGETECVRWTFPLQELRCEVLIFGGKPQREHIDILTALLSAFKNGIEPTPAQKGPGDDR